MAQSTAITIEDVAQAVGVSRQTVSRVLNDGPNVKPAVRQKVEEAIDRLGYVPNLAARRMGGGRSFVILAINDRQRTIENWKAGRGNDWVDQMLYGGIIECEKHGYHLVFELIDNAPADARRQLSNAIASIRPDGVILTPPHSENNDLVDLLSDKGIPCARVGRFDGGGHVDVSMDESGAAKEVTEYLLELGHRRIAFLAGSQDYGNSLLRIKGYREALANAGLPRDAAILGNGDFSFQTASRVLEELMTSDEHPTAIIADNDEMAFAALHIADKHGIPVPGKLSVVSFEDTPGVRFSVPPLTAIRQPTAEMIGTACKQLIAITKGDAGGGNFQAPYTFVKRASSGKLLDAG